MQKTNPKLDQAMQEIKAILEAHNLAGVITIHTPGTCKYFLKLDTSWSCVHIDQSGKMSFRADLKKDFGGNKAALEERVSDTAEMLTALVEVTANVIMPVAVLRKNIFTLLQPAEAVIKTMGNEKE